MHTYFTANIVYCDAIYTVASHIMHHLIIESRSLFPKDVIYTVLTPHFSQVRGYSFHVTFTGTAVKPFFSLVLMHLSMYSPVFHVISLLLQHILHNISFIINDLYEKIAWGSFASDRISIIFFSCFILIHTIIFVIL